MNVHHGLYRLGDFQPQLPADGEYWIAPNAAIIGNVILNKNASVWFGATIRGDNEPIVIGENTNIQDGSVLHSDPGSPLSVGANVTVGHQVMLHGCEIGDNTLVGIGSIVLNGAKIGRGSLIGANALVTENKIFPDNSLLMGSPAKLIRVLSDDEARKLALSAEHYVANWKRFRAELTPL
ncbi:gamma carbonic anhydrase family protein [Niveispirillum sp. KHB5.9]|uniref:gamma carbonic anhydrase family protein n=1 Tax=Niveispirillum sp. KHB5.9 TaxID=3400269 RepID=UPI003A85CD0D